MADFQDHHYPSEMSVDAMIQTFLMDDSSNAVDTFLSRFDKEWKRYNRDLIAKSQEISGRKGGTVNENEKVASAKDPDIFNHHDSDRSIILFIQYAAVDYRCVLQLYQLSWIR